MPQKWAAIIADLSANKTDRATSSDKNLQLDYVEILHPHYPLPRLPGQVNNRKWDPDLAALKKAGSIHELYVQLTSNLELTALRCLNAPFLQKLQLEVNGPVLEILVQPLFQLLCKFPQLKSLTLKLNNKETRLFEGDLFDVSRYSNSSVTSLVIEHGAPFSCNFLARFLNLEEVCFKLSLGLETYQKVKEPRGRELIKVYALLSPKKIARANVFKLMESLKRVEFRFIERNGEGTDDMYNSIEFFREHFLDTKNNNGNSN